jgi:hypothetical protein
MQTRKFLTTAAAFGLLSVMVLLTARGAQAQGDRDDRDDDRPKKEFVPPAVFQSAGPTSAVIQSSVDQYRNRLGDNNLNKEGQSAGRREINWDGGSTTNLATTISGNPFNGFQVTRGALFTTPDGTGFVQAPPSGLASAAVFNNPSYATIFTTFSPSRLFSAIGSNVTDVTFFVPGPNNGNQPATTNAFGAVFIDVDQPDGSGPDKKGNRHASTLIEYFGIHNELLFSSFVPASPGDGGQSFFGVVFSDASIARVRITSGNVNPGADDEGRKDVVMMDDFIYGEPKSVH